VALSKTSDAAGLNMKEAVAQGKGAVDRMKLVPSSVGQIQGAVDTLATVIKVYVKYLGPAPTANKIVHRTRGWNRKGKT
jgi:hypothetical protein